VVPFTFISIYATKLHAPTGAGFCLGLMVLADFVDFVDLVVAYEITVDSAFAFGIVR
jgi:hypothetical protein